MKPIRYMTFSVIFAAAVVLQVGALAQPAPPTPGTLADLTRLDLLPRFKQSTKVAMFSSYDRTGGNDDGFSGKYSFTRKEGESGVIVDLKGPGVVTRVWTPTPTDAPIDLYFDDETTPRFTLKFREFFTGAKPPFVRPYCGLGGGGFYSYLPLPYSKSFKMVYRGPKLEFIQVNYSEYAPGTPIQSWTPSETAPGADIAAKLLGDQGSDISALGAGDGVSTRTTKVKKKLKPSKSEKLFETGKGGRIVGLRLSPASAFAGKDRAFVLKAYWDGEKTPAVLSPVGDFFGYSWGDPAMQSSLVGSKDDVCYFYLPMPYEKSAKIEIANERTSGPEVEIQAEIVTTDVAKTADEGRFYALYRRENPTTDNKPFTWVDTQGRGHIVGCSIQSQGMVSGVTPFFEGDDQVTLDGELVIHGTGSEDAFNGGWYDAPGRWYSRVSFPLSGCLDYQKALGRTGAYRFFLSDAYAFQKSALFTIEHGPTKNNIPCDYSGVVYLYLDGKPTGEWSIPPVEQRAAVDFDRIVYTPGWSVPVFAWSFHDATLEKMDEKIDGKGLRYLKMKTKGDDFFGPHSLVLLCEAPAAGKYRILLDAVKGPDQAVVQLFLNERAEGDQADLYSETRTQSGPILMGTLDLKKGDNQIFFKLVGINALAKDLNAKGLDLAGVVLERVK
jgi:hypothetical protein